MNKLISKNIRRNTKFNVKDHKNITQEKVLKLLYYIGGMENIKTINSCATRLRLTLLNIGLLDEKGLKSIGAFGLVRNENNFIQIVLGSISEEYSERITKMDIIPSYSQLADMFNIKT